MRNYGVGSILIRREAGKGHKGLVVESISASSRDKRAGTVTLRVRHEDGHRELLIPRDGIPIERALFGYRVVTGDDLARGFVEMNGVKVLLD